MTTTGDNEIINNYLSQQTCTYYSVDYSYLVVYIYIYICVCVYANAHYIQIVCGVKYMYIYTQAAIHTHTHTHTHTLYKDFVEHGKFLNSFKKHIHFKIL